MTQEAAADGPRNMRSRIHQELSGGRQALHVDRVPAGVEGTKVPQHRDDFRMVVPRREVEGGIIPETVRGAFR